MYCSQLVTHPVSNPVPSGLFNLSSTLSFASHVEAEFSYITCAQHRFFARGCEMRISSFTPKRMRVCCCYWSAHKPQA